MAEPLTEQERANVQRIVQNALEGISNPSFFGDEVHLLARHIAAQAETIRSLQRTIIKARLQLADICEDVLDYPGIGEEGDA